MRLAIADAQRPFDLTQAPLLRVCLLKLDRQEHVLLLNLHHIVSDGWSMGILVREMAAIYQAVVDKNTHAVLAQWPIKEAEQNAPVAFDEANRRLFIVTRKPGKLVIVNADTGASIASFKAPERSDEVVFDTAHRRIYVLGGEGYIGVYDISNPDKLFPRPRLCGEKTGPYTPHPLETAGIAEYF